MKDDPRSVVGPALIKLRVFWLECRLRAALGRTARAETKYDRRIIGASLLAVAWISFCAVAEGMTPADAAPPTFAYHFKIGALP